MSEVVYEISGVAVGDLIAYPGLLPTRFPRGVVERTTRDWLRVTRIEQGHIIGVREHPEAWEADQEYHVYPEQLRVNGVALEPSA